MTAMRVDRAIAPILALWLSGVCCLLLCVSVCAEPASTPAEHDCCARSAAIEAEESCEGAVIAVEGRGSGGTCCFLASRHATNAPLPEGSSAPLAPPVAGAAPVAVAAAPMARVPVAAAPVQNRGDTYLRCCVFLI